MGLDAFWLAAACFVPRNRVAPADVNLTVGHVAVSEDASVRSPFHYGGADLDAAFLSRTIRRASARLCGGKKEEPRRWIRGSEFGTASRETLRTAAPRDLEHLPRRAVNTRESLHPPSEATALFPDIEQHEARARAAFASLCNVDQASVDPCGGTADDQAVARMALDRSTVIPAPPALRSR